MHFLALYGAIRIEIPSLQSHRTTGVGHGDPGLALVHGLRPGWAGGHGQDRVDEGPGERAREGVLRHGGRFRVSLVRFSVFLGRFMYF